MYRNLIAEMARNDVKRADIAKAIGCSYNHTREKINGKFSFEWDEACIIHEQFFSHLDIKYLFEKTEEVS